VEENGRTYHRFREGSKFPLPELAMSNHETDDFKEYYLPNDEASKTAEEENFG
jgi:hypothetical protein